MQLDDDKACVEYNNILLSSLMRYLLILYYVYIVLNSSVIFHPAGSYMYVSIDVWFNGLEGN